ncbi:hypothetical protein BDV98DRAFT_331228 [Pterulicium gracile]|uniref:Phosphodiesterase n=1 Tax=Pterulicium gracile TaxID=1884261 RepID=A0A5C3QS34_9AGAR|nr:hypothetical protein BDV98DRAFT_331228 [Pterula gracilis]
MVNSQFRRKSIDIGGLLLAAENQGSGYGWGGWDEWERSLEPHYAETLGYFLEESLHAVKMRDLSADDECSMQGSRLSRRQLAAKLGAWDFCPRLLPELDLLRSAYMLFEALFRTEGMEEETGVSLNQVSSFLLHLRQLYRTNDYHNFEHALDVLQATYRFLRSAKMVPPVEIVTGSRTWKSEREHDLGGCLVTCLRKADMFALCIAAIGHDVGHPGLTNNFMNNSNSPLSVVYDRVSPLEQMHCYLLLKLMRLHGLGAFLDKPGYGTHNRRLLWETVLVTDMTLHGQFMDSFKKLLTPELVPLHLRQILTCQAIIKCADISNPARPYSVAQYWAGALAKEWFCQQSLENRFKLPSTVYPSNDPLKIAEGQIWFINAYTLPLLLLTTEGIPEMTRYAQNCQGNLRQWEHKRLKLPHSTPVHPTPGVSSQSEDGLHDVLPFTVPPCFRSVRPEFWHCAHTPSHSSGPASSCSSDTRVGTLQDTATTEPSSPISPCESSFSSRMSLQSEYRIGRTQSPSPSVDSSSSTAVQQCSLIRAAFHVGPRKRKEIHRSSWNPHSKYQFSPQPPEWTTDPVGMIVRAQSMHQPDEATADNSTLLSDSIHPISTTT